ncbi:hypothetical protein L249_7020 [Ophiocordyceps polyrhachis-furcata BCC 54312]|uniref:Uncharacterized protein n=1 Tax=Ophiocordyceps polyrhachis-furcata BCC 54312 TaxID=1330021 RepID=A0A367LKJ6_9HYPO|nr:hypothetical protein L249_7020 [Ophiocordyceps polyrhachis-furcata BCC 54312]
MSSMPTKFPSNDRKRPFSGDAYQDRGPEIKIKSFLWVDAGETVSMVYKEADNQELLSKITYTQEMHSSSILTICLLLWHDHTLAAPMIPHPGQTMGVAASKAGSSASTSGRGHRTGSARNMQAQFREVSLGVTMPPSRSGLQRPSPPGSSARTQPKKSPASSLGRSPLDEGAGNAPQAVAGTPPKFRKTSKGSSSKPSPSFSAASRSDKMGRVVGKKDLARNPNGMSDEDVSLWAQWLENPKSMPDLPSLTAGAPPSNAALCILLLALCAYGSQTPVQLTIPTLSDVDPRLRGQLVGLLSYQVKIDEANPPVQRLHRKERGCNRFTLFPNQAIDCHGGADFRETRTLLADRKMTFEVTAKTKVKIRTYNDHKKEQVRSSVMESTTSVTEASRGWSVGIQISTAGIGSITVGRASIAGTSGSGLSAAYSETESSGLHRTESRTSEQTCGGRRFCTASDVTFSVTIKGFCSSEATVTCQKTVDACAAADKMPTRCEPLAEWRTETCGRSTQECTLVADLMEGDKPYSIEMFLEDELPPLITGYSAGLYWLDFDRSYLYDPDRSKDRFWKPKEKWHSHPRFAHLDVSTFRHPVPKIVDHAGHALKLDSDEWYYPDNEQGERYATERKGFYGKPTAPPPTQEDVRRWVGGEADDETPSMLGRNNQKGKGIILRGKNQLDQHVTPNCAEANKVMGSYADILRWFDAIKKDQLDAAGAKLTMEKARKEASSAIQCLERLARGSMVSRKGLYLMR